MQKSPEAVKVGIIGCGNISSAYLQVQKKLEMIDVVAVADLLPERAKAQAEKFGISKAYTVDQILADPDIEMIINLTIPAAHYQVAMQALEAGKSVYNEKPFAAEVDQGKQLIEEANRRGLLVGSAPDTFLGSGLQTARKAIDDGLIGDPIATTAFFFSRGPESWHPDPEFFYQPGAGPMFDMGPYYLTALVHLLGPVKRVTASAKVTFPERMIGSQPKYGQMIKVNTPTYISGVLDFASGPVGTIITTFDAPSVGLPKIVIFGTEGNLEAPDPNGFGGVVRVRQHTADEWSEIPHQHGYDSQARGIGAADMAYALRSGRPHRASGELGQHVLELMHAFHVASNENRHVAIESAPVRPAPLPLGLKPGTLDA